MDVCVMVITIDYTHSAVFTWTKLLVVVAELGADERAALDIVPVITSSLLEEHQVSTIPYRHLYHLLPCRLSLES